MHPVTQFVSQGHNITRLTVKIHKDIGMYRRHRGMGKSARVFAIPQFRVDPAPIEEAFRDLRQSGLETTVGIKHHLAGLRPIIDTGVIFRQWRITVPVIQLVDPEPFGFQPVVAVRQLRVGSPDGRHQRIDNFIFNLIVQVAF